MCGIVGQISLEGAIEVERFLAMRDALNHRGPDAADHRLLDDGKVALGHRRLSIIDLSEAGRQPMTNEDGSLWLTFNGEIYNYRQLRDQLLAKEHRFHSSTDSEVLLHGYEEWGIKGLLARLKGMFAFAIWDDKKKLLVAARDRLGIKPFYYRHDSAGLTFASELKGIMTQPGDSSDLDFTAMLDYMVYRFIPPPKTIWKSVNKLPPGHYLIFDQRSHELQTERYWSLQEGEERPADSQAEIRVRELLLTSVQEHLESDVPIGVFLSGGYDSNGLLCCLHELGYSASTFSLGFEGWNGSEHVQARESAKLFGTDHHERVLDADFLGVAEQLANFYDEPLGDPSVLPTYLVCGLAGERVKVCMGGDGGDEVFAGYNWHYEIMNYLKKRNLTRRAKDLLKYGKDLAKVERMYFEVMNWTGLGYRDANALLNGVCSESSLPDDLWLYHSSKLPANPLKAMQWLDFNFFLPESILTKVDRASMAHSLEVRVPYLDHELVEFVYGLEPSVYFRDGHKKFLLERFLQPYFPGQEIFQRKKSGFSLPYENFQTFERMYSTVANGRLRTGGMISDKMLTQIRSRQVYSLCSALFVLELWYRRWVN